MGRVKEMLLNEYEDVMSAEDFTYQYSLWRDSKEYVDMVNNELINTNIEYSTSDVSEAVCYAFGAVQVTQSEVGSDVYSKLIHESIFEYLKR